MADAPRRILVIRRDNIGDLVCTTPLFSALRSYFPQARIAALVNSYNAPALAGNPDVDAVFEYTKAKHRAAGQSVARLYLDRLRLVTRLRRARFDCALLPGGAQASAVRFARLAGVRRVLIRSAHAAGHEVECTCSLLRQMGLDPTPPPLVLSADAPRVAELSRRVHGCLGFTPRRLIGIHISARKPAQRWPGERFVTLIRRLALPADAAIALLWAPGGEDDPRHPGDDGKAARILREAGGAPVVALPTRALDELIAALALCDRVVCSDGGAMHLAAGLGKPIVCLFGNSDAGRWHPWGVPYELIQPDSRDVADVTVDELYAAIERLEARIAAAAGLA